MHKPRVTIIGAGISGLSLAFFLKQALGERIVLNIFESGSRPGGTIGTISENGFVEEKGPNGFLDNRPATWELIRSLNLESKVIRASASSQKRFVYHDGRLRQVPDGPANLFSTNLLSLSGKLRLFMEPFIRANHGESDETLQNFFRRRLGAEIVERLVDPFVSGIYAASLDQLSACATFPKLVEFEKHYGSILKGFIKSKKKQTAAKPVGPRKRTQLASFSGGLVTLIDTLANQFRTELHLNSRVLPIEYKEGSFRFTVEHLDRNRTTAHNADSLIIAVPAYGAAALTSKLNPELGEILTGIPYSPVHVATFGFSENAFAQPPVGFGYLFSQLERREILGCLFSSSIFPERSPKGKILLRVLLGGSAHPEAAKYSDQDVTDKALSNLRHTLGLRTNPEWTRIFRYERAIPQYTIGHLERLGKAERIAKHFPGLALTGNAYRGIGINDCIEESKRLAGEIIRVIPAQAGIQNHRFPLSRE